jgi:hypothetical protein
MSLETKIYTLLSGVVAVVGTRIYPLVAPQEAELPLIVYTRISSGREYSMDGYSNLENPRMQIDCFAGTYAEVKTLSEAVVSAMRAATTFSVASDNPIEFYEDDETYRISTDFSIWHEE